MSSPEPRRVRLLTALLLVATFAAGTVCGAGLCRLIGPPPPPPPPPPPLAGPLSAVDLSPSQREQARAIQERHRPELEAIVRETFPRVRAINDRMRDEMRAILTPDQRRRLDEIEASRPLPPPPPLPGMPPPGMPPPGPPPPGMPPP